MACFTTLFPQKPNLGPRPLPWLVEAFMHRQVAREAGPIMWKLSLVFLPRHNTHPRGFMVNIKGVSM